MKRLVILGSTGSIGESALRVVDALPGRFDVVALAAGQNVGRLLEQAARYGVAKVAVGDPAAARKCVEQAPASVEVLSGDEGVAELAAAEADIVLCAVVGIAGLKPVMAAIEHGTDVALATKEVLVVAGSIVMNAAADHGVRVLPVDSEHSAVFQCLDGRGKESVRRIVLTASGGPFASQPGLDLDKVTVTEALNHPRWNMGKKVSVDSATLMNKGLEIMEAHWLFGMPLDAIDVVVHPESIVHSVVEFVDGTMIAQMCPPDMRFAIQYALTYPDRVDSGLSPLDLTGMGGLHFHEPDERRFPCLLMAREAAETGGTMPAALNAANEVAVQKFLAGHIPFSGIWRVTHDVMEKHSVTPDPALDDLMAADAWARRTAGEL